MINECDINRDGNYDEEESKLVYEYFFEGIKRLGFLTEILANKQKQNLIVRIISMLFLEMTRRLLID